MEFELNLAHFFHTLFGNVFLAVYFARVPWYKMINLYIEFEYMSDVRYPIIKEYLSFRVSQRT